VHQQSEALYHSTRHGKLNLAGRHWIICHEGNIDWIRHRLVWTLKNICCQSSVGWIGIDSVRYTTGRGGDTLVVLAVLDADEAEVGAGVIIDEDDAIRAAASCEHLKQRGIQLLMDKRAHGRGDGHGYDPLKIMPQGKQHSWLGNLPL